MRDRLPHADDVDGDLMTASKSLLLLGWSAPAVLTARVAFERALWAAVTDDKRLRRLRQKGRAINVSRELKRLGMLTEDQHIENVDLYSSLSGVAHGDAVRLFDAVAMVRAVDERLELLTA